jgi:hypothetical protein
MVVLEDYTPLGMVRQILLRQIDFGSFFLGRREENYHHNMCLAATSSTMVIRTLDSPAISTKLFGYLPWHTSVGTLDDVD